MNPEAYLRRLGVPAGVDGPTVQTLRALHIAHLRRIPFENLDIRLGVPISLDLDDIVDNFDEPIPFVTGVDHEDPVGTFRIEEVDGGWELLEDGARQHRFFPTDHDLVDFAEACEWQQTSPDSHFTSGPVCSLRTPSGRVTLRGRQLIVTLGDERDEREVEPAALAATYAARFGIELSAEEAARLA